MIDIFIQYALTFGWAITAAVSMAIAMSIGVKIFTFISPIDEWEEIKNGNLGVAIIVASTIIAMALVVAWTING